MMVSSNYNRAANLQTNDLSLRLELELEPSAISGFISLLARNSESNYIDKSLQDQLVAITDKVSSNSELKELAAGACPPSKQAAIQPTVSVNNNKNGNDEG